MAAKHGIEVGKTHISDLVYVDDATFFADSMTAAITSPLSFSAAAATFGPWVS